jgi:hypothetical protein
MQSGALSGILYRFRAYEPEGHINKGPNQTEVADAQAQTTLFTTTVFLILPAVRHLYLMYSSKFSFLGLVIYFATHIQLILRSNQWKLPLKLHVT